MSEWTQVKTQRLGSLVAAAGSSVDYMEAAAVVRLKTVSEHDGYREERGRGRQHEAYLEPRQKTGWVALGRRWARRPIVEDCRAEWCWRGYGQSEDGTRSWRWQRWAFREDWCSRPGRR